MSYLPADAMTGSALTFGLPGDLGRLIINPEALAHFEAHRQRRWLSTEAGGQLFAIFDDANTIRIVEVTGPRPTDRRTPFGYQPDRLAEKLEIAERFAARRHFVGDWHTHCQKLPIPSGTDERSMSDLVRRSSHGLAGFVMIVVGQAAFPEGLHVSFHSNSASSRLAVIRDICGESARIWERTHGKR